MPKTIKLLTVKGIDALPEGSHCVGPEGLYIRKRESGNQYFFRWKLNKQPTQQKFFPKGYTLQQARIHAKNFRADLDRGIDPKEKEKMLQEQELKRKEQQEQRLNEQETTFGKAYTLFKQYQKNKNRWKDSREGEKKQDQQFRKYLNPAIGNKALKDITPKDIAEILNPIYLRSSSVGPKVKTLAKQVYKWARTHDYGYLDGYTPIGGMLNDLTEDAKKNGPKSRPHGALDYTEIPDFVATVATDYNSDRAKAVIFSILTCTRSQAAREVRWSDLDLDKGIYAIKRESDKKKPTDDRLRIVFLAPSVVQWLRSLPRLATDFVFPSRQTDRAVVANTLGQFINRLHEKKKALDGIGWRDPFIKDKEGNPKHATLHGTARSAFKTWATDSVGAGHEPFSTEAVEYNLLHFPTDKITQAYQRGILEAERRKIMAQWVDFCLSKTMELPK